MTTGYESIMFLLAWYSTSTTLFATILSPVFLNDCITFFGVLGKGMGSLFREFVIGVIYIYFRANIHYYISIKGDSI